MSGKYVKPHLKFPNNNSNCLHSKKNLGPVPERCNSLIPGINVPYLVIYPWDKAHLCIPGIELLYLSGTGPWLRSIIIILTCMFIFQNKILTKIRVFRKDIQTMPGCTKNASLSINKQQHRSHLPSAQTVGQYV